MLAAKPSTRLAGRSIRYTIAGVLGRIDGIGRIAPNAFDRVCARTQCHEQAQGGGNFGGDRHWVVSWLQTIVNARGRKLFKTNDNRRRKSGGRDQEKARRDRIHRAFLTNLHRRCWSGSADFKRCNHTTSGAAKGFQEKRVCRDRKLAARFGTFERVGRRTAGRRSLPPRRFCYSTA